MACIEIVKCDPYTGIKASNKTTFKRTQMSDETKKTLKQLL